MEKLSIFKKYKIYLICGSIIILSLISIFIQKNERNKNLNINGNDIKSINQKIAVYITGEVKNPGVYYLEEGSRLESIIDIAGGITNLADISKLNLSKKLQDADKVLVPKKNENIENETTKTLESEVEVETNSQNECININSASESELLTLKGIGKSTANKIIEYRKKQKFKEIEDVKNVSGVGNAKFENIKEDICVD